MFNFFKNKVKDAFSRFSKGVDEESKEVESSEEDSAQEVPEVKTERTEKPAETEKEESPEKKPTEKNVSEKEPDSSEAKAEPQEAKQAENPTEEKTKEESEERPVGEKKQEKESQASPEKAKTEQTTEQTKEQTTEEPQKRSFLQKIFRRKRDVAETSKEEPVKEEPERQEPPSSVHEKKEEPSPEEEKRTFIGKISDSFTKKSLSESKFNDLFWDLEIALLENNVAVEVVDLLKKEMKDKLVDTPLPRSKIPETIERTLRETVERIFDIEGFDLLKEASRKKPYKILVMGVNGSGKTTTIAKLCRLFQNNGLKPVIAAADTFRAAAIDQLEEHADKLKTKMIRHDYGSDPAAVAFDAIKYAGSKKLDVVIIDTAGRLHSNANLMEELKKVYRVSQPDVTIFIGESITGNDCVEQAKEFNKAVNIDGVILSKADIDEKGGAAISIPYVIGKPILYLGVGQDYDDLENFDKYKIMYRMFGTDLKR